MSNQSVLDFVDDLDGRVKDELATPVEITDEKTFTDLAELGLFTDKRTWKRVENVVVVVVDLKGSTKLDFVGYANTSARLYEALMSNCVRIADRFAASFVDIQGDGLFAMFHGDGAYERALCAGITFKTFSAEVLVPRIQSQFSERFPDTGLKVGMHSGTVVAKKVGIRGTNEPVWAGKPVNWAFKAAQKADADELVATRRVFQKFEDNDYVTHSCGCQGGQPTGGVNRLWSPREVETLPDAQSDCMVLTSSWCKNHGDEFCQAILDGEKGRDDVPAGV